MLFKDNLVHFSKTIYNTLLQLVQMQICNIFRSIVPVVEVPWCFNSVHLACWGGHILQSQATTVYSEHLL